MRFHARDVLVLVTGELPEGGTVEGVRNLLGHMAGNQEGLDVATLVDACRWDILEQHPELTAVAVNFQKGESTPNMMINVSPLTEEGRQRIRKTSQAIRVGR